MAPLHDSNSRGLFLSGALLLFPGLSLLLCAACSPSQAAGCTPGLVRACPCAGGAQGVQTCNPDGQSWSTCTGCPGQADAGRDGPGSDRQLPDLPPQNTDARVPGAWVTIKAGTFTMGSAASSPCHDSTETQHRVTLTNDFQISSTEVTQAQFKEVAGYDPSAHTTCGTTCPVERVNWHEAAAYCNALSRRRGLARCYTCTGVGSYVTCALGPAYSPPGHTIYDCPGYRLPTDAEWECAYRAGTTSDLYNGAISTCNGADPNADQIGWYDKNSGDRLHPVGQKKPNAHGLYDMAGNIREWCHDGYSMDLGTAPQTNPMGPETASARVWRSGSFVGIVRGLRAAFRTLSTPDFRCVYQGFRCARSLR
jgi:formylglycine-generating enzyme required for sulfatase activity